MFVPCSLVAAAILQRLAALLHQIGPSFVCSARAPALLPAHPARRALFAMPQRQQGDNLYYSFDLGPLHVLVYNTGALSIGWHPCRTKPLAPLCMAAVQRWARHAEQTCGCSSERR